YTLVARERDLTQAKIGERLELKSANLSRILGVLEANEVIGRRKDGRSKRVALGPNAPQTAQIPAGEPPGPRPLRTSDLLSPYDAFAWPDAGVEH
ncbi:MAG TPA: MarR family transcriptional regulator, partial [Planctomycetota bacterium]|nr:MarR family transcriptional regulator [Planctomycetota bacterium]